MNIELRTKVKNDFDKYFFKLMNNSVLRKDCAKCKERQRLIPTKWSSKNLLAVNMNKTKLTVNKPVYLGLSILYISKLAMYAYLHNWTKPKYGGRIKLCYTATDSFKAIVKSEDTYADFVGDVETKFDTSECEIRIPLPIGRNEKVIRLIKDELDGRIIKDFVALRQKMYSYLFVLLV